MKFKITLFFLGLIPGLIIGCWIAEYFFVPEIRIVEKSKTKSKYINKLVKTDYKDLWGCYRNPISIDGVMEGNTLQVCATDECKESRKNFKLNARIKNKKNNLIIGNINYSYDFFGMDSYWGGTLNYYRLFGSIGTGGGLTFTQKSVGVQVGILVRF